MVGDRRVTIEKSVGQPFVNMLLVEDNLAEARLLQEILKGTAFKRFDLVHVKRLWEAIAQLHKESFDIILLDLTLPDSQGLASLDALVKQAPGLPIVVLTNTNDEELAVQAVRHGAQDYLVKRNINQELLVRSLRYAIQRKQAAEALREANEILEQRVQERTHELETANKQLKREVEKRQQVQERLELAQKAGKIGTFEWNIQSNTVTWTAELEALYGAESGSFGSHYDRWLQAIHPDDRPKTEQELWQAIQLKHGLDTEFRIIAPNHDTRWIAVKSSLFHDAEDRPQRMIGIHMDITEKKQFEAQFLRAQRLESLGTLASGIAHDLNNVLTPILAIVQLLPMRFPDLNDTTRQMLKSLESSALRGAELVKQILSFARGVEGKRISLQLHHLLLESQAIIDQTFPKSITIQTNIPSDLWAIAADVTQLHQVFMNLFVNARDAMPNGGTLAITAENQHLEPQQVRIHPEANANAYVVVSVADTGCGIPPEILNRIFDPFFTTKDIGKGTGLGLSAVLGIVKSHGGFVDVQSEVGHGSTFKVYLPVSQAIEPTETDEFKFLSGQQELLLIVDDEIAICEIIKTTLENYNYRILTAQTGNDAIALFAQHQHHVQAVLMDIMMPGMDGLAVLPILQRLKPDIYAIAMSGIHSTEAVSQAERQGFKDFLPKPFATTDLLQMLQQGIKTR
ncbi:MAG: response regulator [Leptolyngbyaceae cyanobacterium bins.349]|nr:response regulator [Leptolyngbyaceae cyanobacterium bins.349]